MKIRTSKGIEIEALSCDADDPYLTITVGESEELGEIETVSDLFSEFDYIDDGDGNRIFGRCFSILVSHEKHKNRFKIIMERL